MFRAWDEGGTEAARAGAVHASIKRPVGREWVQIDSSICQPSRLPSKLSKIGALWIPREMPVLNFEISSSAR